MNFNGRYWHKPGHLGMTTAQVKEALQGGGGYNPLTENKTYTVLTAIEFGSLLAGTAVTKEIAHYSAEQFIPYLTVGIPELSNNIILYAFSYVFTPYEKYYTSAFTNTFYNSQASQTYCITATLSDTETSEFIITATAI